MRTTTEHVSKPRTLTRRLLAVAAGTALGISGAVAVASSEDSPRTLSCPATEADLLRAAEAARILEAQRPELFDGTPRADYGDLRYAAEWARRMASLDPTWAECSTE